MSDLEILKERLHHERTARIETNKLLVERSNELFWVKQNLKEMAHVIARMPFPVLRFNKEGQLVFANPAAMQAWGQSVFPGQSLGDAFGFLKDVDLHALIEEDQAFQLYATRHGRYFRFVFQGESKYDMGYIFCYDNTDHELTRQDLQAAQRESEQLLSSFASGLVGIDGTGRIMHWNKSAESLFGLSEVDVMGYRLMDCMIPWERRTVLALLRECHEREAVCEGRVRYTPGDKEEGWLSIVATPISKQGSTHRGVFLLITDVSENRTSDRERPVEVRNADAVSAFEQLVDEISRPMQSIGENMVSIDETLKQVRTILENKLLSMLRANHEGSIEQYVDELAETLHEAEIGTVIDDLPTTLEATFTMMEQLSHMLERTQQASGKEPDSYTTHDIPVAVYR